MEKELTILSEKLSSALSECEAKDELVKKHAKMAQEAIAGNVTWFSPFLELILQKPPFWSPFYFVANVWISLYNFIV